MPPTLVAAQPPAIVMTRVWLAEHDCLHSVYERTSNNWRMFDFADWMPE